MAWDEFGLEPRFAASHRRSSIDVSRIFARSSAPGVVVIADLEHGDRRSRREHGRRGRPVETRDARDEGAVLFLRRQRSMLVRPGLARTRLVSVRRRVGLWRRLVRRPLEPASPLARHCNRAPRAREPSRRPRRGPTGRSHRRRPLYSPPPRFRLGLARAAFRPRVRSKSLRRRPPSLSQLRGPPARPFTATAARARSFPAMAAAPPPTALRLPRRPLPISAVGARMASAARVFLRPYTAEWATEAPRDSRSVGRVVICEDAADPLCPTSAEGVTADPSNSATRAT